MASFFLQDLPQFMEAPVPITIKGFTGYDFLLKVGCDLHLLKTLQENLIYTSLKPGVLEFYTEVKSYAEVPIPWHVVQIVKNGVINGGPKADIAAYLNQVMKDILEGNVQKPISGTLAMLKAGSVVKEPIKALQPGSTNEATPDQKPVTLGPAPEPVTTVKGDFYPESAMKTGPTIQLAIADRMYQPVLGTSAGSRYYVVGLADGIKVAARYTASSVSLRIEGKFLNAQKGRISELGFSVKDSYASVHLQAGDEVVASKIVGAMLAGLGVNFKTPLPNMKVLVGK